MITIINITIKTTLMIAIANAGQFKYVSIPKKAVMVGDNYNTDIKCGINAGVDTLWVNTGVSTHEDIDNAPIKPTHQVESLDQWDV